MTALIVFFVVLCIVVGLFNSREPCSGERRPGMTGAVVARVFH
jgi:hypothetical protein